MDSDLIQNIIMGLTGFGAVGAALWAWLLKQRAAMSETRAAIAEDERDREMANSAHTLYNLLNERLKNVEKELLALKAYSRKLEAHVGKLETMMRNEGLEPPAFDYTLGNL